jgi:hypothetical protein
MRELDIEVKDRYLFFTDLYMWLPFRLARMLEKIYYKLDIRIQGWGYNPVYARTLKQHEGNDN